MMMMMMMMVKCRYGAPIAAVSVFRCGSLSGSVTLPCSARHCRHSIHSAPHRVSCSGFATQSPGLLQSWAKREVRPWMCVKEECRKVNQTGVQHCEACGADKPNRKGWLCVGCGTRNHKGVKRCHKCAAAFEESSDFWMCIACEKNNRIDDLDDNSRCGFCGYDMAPMTMTEADALRIQHERSQRLREAQEQFDSVSASDADEQFGDEIAGASSLPEALQQKFPVVPCVKLQIAEIAPFTPAAQEMAHSRLVRKRPPLPPAGVPPGPPGFDWMCRNAGCGTVNPGDEENCSSCGVHITPAEWECCHCGAVNHMSRSKCFNCRTTISVSWLCPSCKTATSIYDRCCRHCEKSRPTTEPKEARDVYQPRQSGGTKRHIPFKQDWNCVECHGLNFASRTSCYQCGASRSTACSVSPANAGGTESAPEFAVSHNNWFCRYCQASNFRTRTNCWQCGHASSESGATSWSAEDSAPQFEKEGFQQVEDDPVAEGQMRRLTVTGGFLPAVRVVTRSTASSSSSSSSFGIRLQKEEMEDEERLARFLVQGTPTAAAAAAAPLTTAATVLGGREMPLLTVPLATTSVASASSGVTLADEMTMEEDDAATALLRGLPVTHSRRGNDQLAKYAHLRSAAHTKRLKEGMQFVKELALEWMCCSCRTYNFVGRKTCRRCKQRDVESFKHNFPPARHIPLFPSLWTCHPCGHTNRSECSNTNNRGKFFCESCGERFGGIREWYCPSCNHINSRGSTQCATCYEARPASWSCSSCKHEKNSVFSTECRNCRTVRRKFVSDSTALCPVCRQRNDVQWELCFSCMAPLGMMSTVRKYQCRVGGAPMDSAEVPAISAETHEVAPVDVPTPSLNCNDNSHALTISTDVDAAGKEGGEGGEPLLRKTDVESRSQVRDDGTSVGENSEADDLGNWWCKECKVLQRRNACFCDICLKPKNAANLMKTEEQMDRTIANEGWNCGKCAHRNKSMSSLLCERCQEPHEQEVACEQHQQSPVSCDTTAIAASGQWRCPYCRNFVDVMVTSCCGAPREIPLGYWLCPVCCSTNCNERAKCIGCAAPPPEDPWRCLGCRYKNKSDEFFCLRCGSANPHHWYCEKCGVRRQQTSDVVCLSCGAEKPVLEILSCQHCCASNHPSRKNCFRCWSRLSADKWKCSACGSTDNEKLARHCTMCREPRQYNMKETTWICDVCNTSVASGGDLKERTQCPRCNSDRTERNMHFPSRWRCRSCGVANMYAVSSCSECGGRRVLENMRTHTSCTTCFRITLLNEREQCEHCGADLSQVLNEVGSSISLSGLSQFLAPPLADGEPKRDVATAATAAATTMTMTMTTTPLTGDRTLSSLSPLSQSGVMKQYLHEDMCDVVHGDTKALFDGDHKAAEVDIGTESASLFMGFGDKAGVFHVDADDGNDEFYDEETMGEGDDAVGGTDSDLCMTVPSWMCSNCETTNLDDAEVCAACGLRPRDE